MNTNKRVEMIIEFANKVMQYPKGSTGYDPIDEIRLKGAIEKYEEEKKSSSELLLKFKSKIYETGGHMFAAYGFFSSRDFDMARNFADQSRKSLNEVKNYIQSLIDNTIGNE